MMLNKLVFDCEIKKGGKHESNFVRGHASWKAVLDKVITQISVKCRITLFFGSYFEKGKCNFALTCILNLQETKNQKEKFPRKNCLIASCFVI